MIFQSWEKKNLKRKPLNIWHHKNSFWWIKSSFQFDTTSLSTHTATKQEQPLHCQPVLQNPSTIPKSLCPVAKALLREHNASIYPKGIPLGQLFTAACENSTGEGHSHFSPAHPQARIKLGLALWVMAQLCESTESLSPLTTHNTHINRTQQILPTNVPQFYVVMSVRVLLHKY